MWVSCHLIWTECHTSVGHLHTCCLWSNCNFRGYVQYPISGKNIRPSVEEMHAIPTLTFQSHAEYKLDIPVV